ncbi:MAG: hypothetical protein ACI4GC_03785 [Acutalibacteraceae bacterium]
MRKHILPILLVLLMVLLVGCSQTNELPQDTEISSSSDGEFSELKQDENLTDEPSVTLTESTASSTEIEVVTEPTESRDNEDKKPTTSSVSKPTEETEKVPETSGTKPTQSQTEKDATEKKPTETQSVKPPEEIIPDTTVPSSEQTEPTEKPTTEPETTEQPKAFDIDYWIGFAKNYAKSKGLVLDAAAVDCWDNPIRAGSHCIYLERDIQSRLNRYANDEDITDVWIWAESVGNDCYDIYIGYA